MLPPQAGIRLSKGIFSPSARPPVGDAITIDARAKTISVDLSIAEIARRRKSWKPREIAYATGTLAKYARLVSSASRGAVTG
jgi:dihydroxy-acid dehydratase